MKNFLVKMREDWADEFDCEGSLIIDEETRDEYLKKLKMIEKLEVCYGIDFGFGTNEGWFEDEGGGLCIETVTGWFENAKELTDEEASVLKKFGFDSFGILDDDILDAIDTTLIESVKNAEELDEDDMALIKEKWTPYWWLNDAHSYECIMCDETGRKLYTDDSHLTEVTEAAKWDENGAYEIDGIKYSL